MIMALDVMQVPHGRAPSVATGAKRARPEAVVFTRPGDRDVFLEGLREVLHAAACGKRFTAVVFNNAVFGEPHLGLSYPLGVFKGR